MARSGKFDEATDEFLWLWDNMLAHDRAMAGVRLSFMVGDMQSLAARHAHANEAFTKLRDRYQPAIDDGSAKWDEITDWSRLNRVIGDDGAMVAWYDRVKGDSDKAKIIREAERELFGELIDRGRWSDAGQLCADPAGRARLYVMSVRTMRDFKGGGTPEDRREEMIESTAAFSRSQIAQLYAACLAAGRDASAEEVATIGLDELNDFKLRLALVETAMKAEQPRPMHLKWLDEAEAAGERNDRLRSSVQDALKTK
jgi:hypothetical protein